MLDKSFTIFFTILSMIGVTLLALVLYLTPAQSAEASCVTPNDVAINVSSSYSLVGAYNEADVAKIGATMVDLNLITEFNDQIKRIEVWSYKDQNAPVDAHVVYVMDAEGRLCFEGSFDFPKDLWREIVKTAFGQLVNN